MNFFHNIPVIIGVLALLLCTACGAAPSLPDASASVAVSEPAEAETSADADLNVPEDTLQLYSSVLDTLSQDAQYTFLDMGGDYPVLAVAPDGVYDKNLSFYGNFYCYLDGEVHALGSYDGGGTAYPLAFSGNQLFTEWGHGGSIITFDLEKGAVFQTETFEESDADDKPSYTYNGETCTQERFQRLMDTISEAKTIHFVNPVDK